MKKVLRPVAALLVAAFFSACVSPYQAQMQAVHNAYATGNMSEAEYRARMNDLSVADAGWQQENANAATTAAVVGAAAIGVAALSDHNHHHHHGYWRRGHWHRW
jgi:hypothetical protein